MKVRNANGACGHCNLDPETGKNESCGLDLCYDSVAYDPQAVLDWAKREEELGIHVSKREVQRAQRILADRAIASRELSDVLATVPFGCR